MAHKGSKPVRKAKIEMLEGQLNRFIVNVSYAAPQAHRIVNVALHREYSSGVIFIFSQWRKYLYFV
jgi:hypothetical protein